MKTRTNRLAALALVATGVAIAGCGYDSRWEELKFDPTPELATLHQTHVDTQNSYAIMSNENWRMINQDLLRFFYLDRPSRLTREPIIVP